MYPEDSAEKTWAKDGITYSIVRRRGMGYYCGYCRLPKRITLEDGYRGILTYVPVHGGIAYSNGADDGSMVYGFDCAHAGDDDDPKLRDMAWLEAECERMAQGIIAAAKYETDFLTASDQEAKANILDAYHAEMRASGVEFVLTDNFGAMIGVVFGNL